MPAKPNRSLESVVGKEMYSAWTSMLRALAPDSHADHLALLVAAMLQYAASIVPYPEDEEEGENSVAQSLRETAEVTDSSEIRALLQDVVVQLFKDANVKYRRRSSHGMERNIISDAYEEFLHWCDRRWE